jgi:hypothetical protein
MRYGRILKKEKNITEKDSDEYGDVYTLTAINTDTRLFVCHHEGDRTTEDAIELFGDVERRRSIHSQIPVFTSDNWDPFEEGLLNIYGFLNLQRDRTKTIALASSLSKFKICSSMQAEREGQSCRSGTTSCVWGFERGNEITWC